ncbi:MAG: YfhO family protein [Bacteroidaceae bacterium]|nr:YfhO family protein [Bacteroidaceae bacterium]
MKKANLKKLSPFIVALIAFLAIGFLYCSPVLEGKVLQAGDTTNYLGASNEIRQYTKSEGRQMWWTNSMFGGMPSYQISGQTPANKLRAKLERLSHLWLIGSREPIGILVAYMIGFFIMLLCFDVDPWMSIAGAIALTLSSYFLLILPAGHVTKANAICCLAPMIGGFYAIFRSRFWLGVPVTLFYGTIGLTLHSQMTYYAFMLLGVLFISEIFIHAKAKTWKEFGKATGVFILSLLLVLGTKLSWFQMNRSYLNETMRGGHSELVSDNAEGDDQEKLVGLDFDYATAWSYGKTETFTLLVPEYMGGASGYDLGKDSKLEKELRSMGVPANSARSFCSSSPVYWGEKVFTSGPVYVGAVICFLFILGLIVVKGAYKWSLFAATCFSILLAWGHNWEWFSRLFFDYFPMYNKFRTVESILVVAEITMPLLGFLAIRHLVQSDDKAANRKAILTAGAITAAICLLVAISAGFTDTASSYDIRFKDDVGDTIYDAILRQRQALISSSALRSLVFVLLGAGATYAYTVMKEKKNSNVMFAAALTALILIDMVPVDRKFFGKQNFITTKENSQIFAMQDWEKAILQDQSLDYRVLNLSTNTFNEARTSYRLNSLGGYSAAKMRRYQDLIDTHISKNNMSVLNMLNTKYLITDNRQILRNPEAMGNAWFVDTVLFVNSPVSESQALNIIDVRTTAVADNKFADILNVSVSASDPEAFIRLDKYVPDRLEYTSSSTKDKVAVFSEIYYPNEWHLYIDGKEHEIGRVNYVLRAAVIPAGKHSIVMEFVPNALKNDWICMILVILTIIISIGMPVWHFVKKQ